MLGGVAMALTVASGVRAAESNSGEPSANVAAAEALFERGRELMAQRRVKEACPLFEESQRLDAGIGTQFNLAACYEAAGRFASAYTLFLEVAEAARARIRPSAWKLPLRAPTLSSPRSRVWSSKSTRSNARR